MHASSRQEIQVLKAGDIGAILGLKFTVTGDTLCHEQKPLILERIAFPQPVISMVIEAKTSADQKKLTLALQNLEREDPSCQVHKDSETGQTLLSGMGELHLEVLRDRLLREHQLALNIGAPQVSYRETLSCKAQGKGVFNQEVGGKKHYAKVKVQLVPLDRYGKKHLDFKMALKLDSSQQKIMTPYEESVKQGCFEALSSGVLAGYSTLFVEVLCVGVDLSSEEDLSLLAFKNAATFATREAMKQGQAQFLEPIFSLEISCPEPFTGNLVGDIHARRGKIISVESSPQDEQFQILKAEAPLASLFGYATDVRSLSQGRASFTMRFLHYDVLPEKESRAHLQQP